MPRTHDDFGFVKPLNSGTKKGPGIFTPRHFIGRNTQDVASTETKAEPRFNGIRDLVKLAASRRQGRVAEFADFASNEERDAATPVTPAASSRGERKANAKSSGQKYSVKFQPESQLTDLSSLQHDIEPSAPSEGREPQEEASNFRRLRRPVFGPDGAPMSVQTPSANSIKENATKSRQGDQLPLPAPQKNFCGGSKRHYAWLHRPTAWDNPVTYEDPPELGKRPSHPVCANGVVATDRKRSFPERALVDNCGELLVLDDGPEAEARGSEAGMKPRCQIKYPDTSWLLRWHWNPQDAEPPKPRKFSLNVPIAACSSTRAETVYQLPAGKPGTSDRYQLADAIEELQMMPLTAR